MSASTDDIDIVDLDLPRTTWSRVHSSMRTLYLKLSREPDTRWIRFFHEERESRVVIKRHGLWIEEGYIVFDCLLDDVATHHLPDFRRSVEFANNKYRELMRVQREEGEQNRQDALDEKKELVALRARIRNEAEAQPSAPASRAEDEAALPLPLPDTASANDEFADFNARRDEWRARFRAALASANKEPARGND
jgi:hypothetical protein